jgi:hypothetical protein
MAHFRDRTVCKDVLATGAPNFGDEPKGQIREETVLNLYEVRLKIRNRRNQGRCEMIFNVIAADRKEAYVKVVRENDLSDMWVEGTDVSVIGQECMLVETLPAQHALP